MLSGYKNSRLGLPKNLMLKNVLLFNKFYHSIYWHKHCIPSHKKEIWEIRIYLHHRPFIEGGFLCKGGMLMSFERSCKFYQDSKCILQGGCCDLHCELTNFDSRDQFYDEMDPFTEWQIEKIPREDIKSGWKLS